MNNAYRSVLVLLAGVALASPAVLPARAAGLERT